MKHINLTNWRGSITDWTKLNYIYGGLDDSYAVKGNLRIDKDNYNYVEYRESKNLFDKSSVLNRTYIHSDGTLKTETTDGWITSQPIEIKDSLSFNFNTSQVRYRLLDENQNYIVNSYALITNASGTITNMVNAKYFQFSIRINDIDTFMISKGSTAPTIYEPYFEGKKYVITEKLGIVDLGTLNYQKLNNRILSSNLASVIKKPTNSEIANILTTKYTTTSYNNVFNHSSDKIIGVQDNGNLGIYDTEYYDNFNEQTFKSAMSGVTLVYELATPVIEVVS